MSELYCINLLKYLKKTFIYVILALLQTELFVS